MADDFRADAWFSGLAAGEGSFILANRSRNGIAPCFVLALRADDLETLESLKAAFGGSLRIAPARDRNKPVAFWTVASKHELAGLIAYFDRFPLRAKKARDYVIWRRAVRIYRAGGHRAPELLQLKEALMAGRKYDAPEPVSPESPQLRLVS